MLASLANSLSLRVAAATLPVPPTASTILDRILGSGGFVNVFLFGLAPAVAVIMIAYAGFNKIMAADNAQAVKQADQIILLGNCRLRSCFGRVVINRFGSQRCRVYWWNWEHLQHQLQLKLDN